MKIELKNKGIPEKITFCCNDLANKLFYMPDCLNFLKTESGKILVTVNEGIVNYCPHCGAKIEANIYK